ncbi:MAG: alpha/beta hydrolase [Acidobacteriota bacterium]|nr:alpha/beta hydrolase [Acidobacteriota bacterium]
MPLDPQAEALLSSMKDAGAKPFETMTPAEARVAAWAFKDLGGPPEAVASLHHRFVPGPTADLPVRIYRPSGAGDEDLPGLVYFHGSGWVVLNIEICDAFSRALANRTGCVVVAVNYQKAPEHKFPIPLDDCYAATRWVFDNAGEVGVDPTRIGVIGDSAGGNLAAAVTLRARDENGPPLAYQVLVYPAVQYGWDTPSALANAEGFLLQRASMEYFWTHYVRSPSDAEHPYCSPLAAEDHAGLPPALIVSAEFDPLCDDGRNYANKLEAAGVPTKFSVYDGMIHGFLWMSGVLDQSKALVDEIGREVRAVLG